MSPSRLFFAAARMARRDLRSGEVRLLVAALALAVAAVSSVSFLVERARLGMARDAASLLAADALIESDRPIDPAIDVSARGRGLRTSGSEAFPSMALATGPDAPGRLVMVKAVKEGYPLRGELRIRAGEGPGDAADAPSARPLAGEVFVDERVLVDLSLRPGDSLRLGRSTFRIGAVLTYEPDRATPWMGFAPRVLMREEDLAATALVQPASRVSWRWLVAGDPAPLRSFLDDLASRLPRGQHVESALGGRQDIGRSVERADRFLGLVALLTALTAAVAVAVCARRFVERRLDACALMRCLGATPGRIFALYGVELALLGLAASLAGLAAGFGLHFALAQLLAPLAQQEHFPWPPATAALRGLLTGMVLLAAFALPPILALRRVSPVRVLRRDLGRPDPGALLAWLAGAAGFAALLLRTGGDLKLGAITGGGFLGCVVGFALLARAILYLLQFTRGGPARHSQLASGLGQWRLALAGLRRRPAASVVQAVALSIGLTALLLLAVIRGDLLNEWKEQAPADAPDRFVLNIQPEQTEGFSHRLQEKGIDVPLLPMIRGRLVRIDGRDIGPDDFHDEQARSLIDREFNLSTADSLPPGNELAAGRWFARGSGELSIEQGIARRLGIQTGQKLTFDIAGELVEARVTSIRTLQWSSMKVNFFVIMDPDLLREAPRTYITSFRMPPGDAGLGNELARAYPNITIIDTAQVLAQVRAVLGHLADAAQFLFAFALAAGVLVLLASLLASQDERLREAALLRAFGATRSQLARVHAIELATVGAIAGLLAALGTSGVGWALARWVFDFPFTPPPWLFAAGLAAGMGCAILGGRAGLQRLLRTPPWRSLREA